MILTLRGRANYDEFDVLFFYLKLYYYLSLTKTLIQTLFLCMCDIIVEIIHNKLQNINSYSISINGWQNILKDKFITITCHSINHFTWALSYFSLSSYTLFIRQSQGHSDGK